MKLLFCFRVVVVVLSSLGRRDGDWNRVGKASAICCPSPLCWAPGISVIKASVGGFAGQEERKIFLGFKYA